MCWVSGDNIKLKEKVHFMLLLRLNRVESTAVVSVIGFNTRTIEELSFETGFFSLVNCLSACAVIYYKFQLNRYSMNSLTCGTPASWSWVSAFSLISCLNQDQNTIFIVQK